MGASGGPDLWLRRFHPAADNAPKLLCFPRAGGSAVAYFPLSRLLAPDVDVAAVQYPGRQDRRAEPPAPTVGELADALAEIVADAYADAAERGMPVAFFGHSMGAIVAFEVALRLARGTGSPVPSMLFASGRRAPSRHRDETVHLRDDRGVLDELRALSGTGAAVFQDEELVRMVMPAIRADYRAIETYRAEPGAVLTRPVVALVGDADPRVTSDEAEAWRTHTTAPFEMHTFPGGHFYLDGRLAEVAAVLRRILA
ncbi:thioesterase II family protein [Yinghuangia seranimata]|uniref:thioesterase II family protein n=1 Tax=Yinghuangia seranimata TaxID=408067 RepID=UPI00248AFA24|nr:alpha/beta fold hydrolase [Yinghuangia seranimata]MDI2128520.1 alpha/beta fold hydrolase [Yinghuangia seranimata]